MPDANSARAAWRRPSDARPRNLSPTASFQHSSPNLSRSNLAPHRSRPRKRSHRPLFHSAPRSRARLCRPRHARLSLIHIFVPQLVRHRALTRLVWGQTQNGFGSAATVNLDSPRDRLPRHELRLGNLTAAAPRHHERQEQLRPVPAGRNRRWAPHAGQAVSYTHLDVYKRQSILFSSSSLRRRNSATCSHSPTPSTTSLPSLRALRSLRSPAEV